MILVQKDFTENKTHNKTYFFKTTLSNMFSKNVVIIMLVAALGMSTVSTVSHLDDVFAKGTNLDENDYATKFIVRITDKDGIEHTFFTFSKISFVRSVEPKFQLDSLPSKDKGIFYEIVSQSLKSPYNSRFDVSLDLLAADNSLVETYNYKKCEVESHFVYVNDSKGKFSFLEDANSKLEIREATKFACTGLSIEN